LKKPDSVICLLVFFVWETHEQTEAFTDLTPILVPSIFGGSKWLVLLMIFWLELWRLRVLSYLKKWLICLSLLYDHFEGVSEALICKQTCLTWSFF
jgi:hypothetical protein